jgi:hypothetical protein
LRKTVPYGLLLYNQESGQVHASPVIKGLNWMGGEFKFNSLKATQMPNGRIFIVQAGYGPQNEKVLVQSRF